MACTEVTDKDEGIAAPPSKVLDLLEQLRFEYARERATWAQGDFKEEVRSHEDGTTSRKDSSDIRQEQDDHGDSQMTPVESQLSLRESQLLRSMASREENPTNRVNFDLRLEWVELPIASMQRCSDLAVTEWITRTTDSRMSMSVTGTRSSIKLDHRRCFIAPNSNKRVGWDLGGFFLIAYDVLSIPLLAFNLPNNTFTSAMDGLTLVFWTCDALQSFFLGYYEKGVLITDRYKIFRHYLLTWFILDCVVLGPDWFMNVTHAMGRPNEDTDVSGLGRLFRATRAMRVLRLLRLFKLQRILGQMEEMIESEHAFTVLGLIKLLVCILVLNHVIACIWYLIGHKSMDDGMKNWLEKTGTNDTDIAYSYTTSLHWSLTQFTPASVDVSATNVHERIFSILVLLFAIVAFSSIVASITGSMASINNSHTEEMKQFWLLRKYLRQRHVDKELTTRIFKYLEHQICSQIRSVQEANIKLLCHLSDPLKDELRSAIYAPILVNHGFFDALDVDMPFVIPQLCHSSVMVSALAAEDGVFTCDAEARYLYLVKSGVFRYRHKFATRVKGDVVMNEWICEPSFWTPWRHFGDLVTAVPSEMLTVDPKGFAATCAIHARAWAFAKHYADAFILHLNSTEAPWGYRRCLTSQTSFRIEPSTGDRWRSHAK